MGIDGRIFPVGSKRYDAETKKGQTASMFAGDWFPIQVKQKDKVGRPDIDAFEAVMAREERQREFFVAFGYTAVDDAADQAARRDGRESVLGVDCAERSAADGRGRSGVSVAAHGQSA